MALSAKGRGLNSRTAAMKPLLSSEKRLAKRVSKGDEAAFTEIYSRYHQPLYRYCRSILRNEQDAEDALQSTMAAALTAMRSGSKDIAVRPWLFRVAHNESISLLRRRRFDEVRADEQALLTAPSGSEPGEALERRERLSNLVKDLDSLAIRQRSALLMRELNGLSIEEIADALSTTPGAAKQALFEARTALRERVEGREMGCETVTKMILEGDGRVLRGRKVKSHLASCESCNDLVSAMRTRTADLHALAPALPTAAASAVLAGLLGNGGGAAAGASAGGGAAGGAGGGAGASANAVNGVPGGAGSAAAGASIHIGGALVVKAAVSVLLVAAVAGGATQIATSSHRSPGGGETPLFRSGGTGGGARMSGTAGENGTGSATKAKGSVVTLPHSSGRGGPRKAGQSSVSKPERGRPHAHPQGAGGIRTTGPSSHAGNGIALRGGEHHHAAKQRGSHARGEGSTRRSGPRKRLRKQPHRKRGHAQSGESRGGAGVIRRRRAYEHAKRSGEARSHTREGALHAHEEAGRGTASEGSNGVSSGKASPAGEGVGRSGGEAEPHSEAGKSGSSSGGAASEARATPEAAGSSFSHAK